MQTYIIETLKKAHICNFNKQFSHVAQGGYVHLVGWYKVSKHYISHCRLERLLGLQSLKHVLHKQPILMCPKLSLRNRSQLSDLLLVSNEGEEISCHKCVLVARSGKKGFLFE